MCKSLFRKCSVNAWTEHFLPQECPSHIYVAQHLKKLACWQCGKSCVRTFQSTPNIKPVCWQSMKSLCAPLCNNVLLITITFQKCPSHISAVRPLKKLINWHHGYNLTIRRPECTSTLTSDHLPSRDVTECSCHSLSSLRL